MQLTGTLAVISQSGSSLTFPDLATGQRTAHLPNLPAEPHELAHDAKRGLLYVSHTYRHGHYGKPGARAHEISVVDVVSHTVVDTIDIRPAGAPHGLHLDLERDVLYATVEFLLEDAGGVIGIELAMRKVVKRIGSGWRSHWLVVTPDGRKAFTCNKTAEFVSVLDLEAERLVKKIGFPSCEHPGISKDGRYAYFPTPGLSLAGPAEKATIEVIDTATKEIVRSIPVASNLLPLVVSPRGTIVAGWYVFERNDQTGAYEMAPAKLAMWDLDTFELLGEVEIGKGPLTITFTPDADVAFVANIFDRTVSVVDMDARKVVRTIENDVVKKEGKAMLQGAHGLAFIP